MAYYVDTSQLTGLYARRQAALEAFLHTQGQGVGPEWELLLGMNARVETPFRYQWTGGWMRVLGDALPDMGTIMALFLAIVLSSAFSGEWHSGAAALLLTTDRGWRCLARVKIASGLAFAAELFALAAAGSVNMLQAEVYEYAFALLGAVGYAGVVMLLSSLVKSNALALLLSLAAVYGPAVLAQYLPMGMQKTLDLLPLVGSSADIFRTNTFHIFGRYIWSPYLLVTVPVLLGLACTPLAVRRWSRRMRV